MVTYAPGIASLFKAELRGGRCFVNLIGILIGNNKLKDLRCRAPQLNAKLISMK